MDLHLVNTKKRLEAYLVGHPLCKSAVNENGKITKSSIEYRLRIIRTEECVPESLQEDVNQLKVALVLCGKLSEYNKVVKDLNKALDEKLIENIPSGAPSASFIYIVLERRVRPSAVLVW